MPLPPLPRKGRNEGVSLPLVAQAATTPGVEFILALLQFKVTADYLFSPAEDI